MSTSNMTIIAQLEDRMSGPLKKVKSSVEDTTKSVEDHGKKAVTSYDKAAVAVGKNAKATQQSTSKMERALSSLTGTVTDVGREFNDTQKKADRALSILVRDTQNASSRIDRALTGAAEQGGRGMVANLKTAGARFVSESRDIGRRAGQNIKSGIEDALQGVNMSGGAAGATAAGAAGLYGSFDRTGINARNSAMSGVDSDKLARSSEAIYNSGRGSSYEQVSGAGAAIGSTLGVDIDSPDFQRLQSGAVTIEELFGIDAASSTMTVSIIAEADDISAVEAQNRMAKFIKDVPIDARDEWVDNQKEYIANLKGFGLTGTEVMQATGIGAQHGGSMGSDKTADFLKEMGIRSGEADNKDVKAAYSELGMNQADVNKRMMAGDATVFDEIFDKMSGMSAEDQARISVALGGTQAEDIGRANMPTMIKNLSGMNMGSPTEPVEDTVGNMNKEMENSPAAEFTKMMRELQQAFIDVGDTIGPFLVPLFKLVGAMAPVIAIGATLVTVASGARLAMKAVGFLGLNSDKVGKAGKAGAKGLNVMKTGAIGLNTALRANPIGLVVTAVWLLTEALGWAYDNIGWVKTGFDGMVGILESVNNWFNSIGDSIDRLIAKIPGLEKVMNLGGATTFVQDQVNTQNEESFANGLHNSDFFTGTRKWLGTGEFGNSGEGLFGFLHGSDNEKDNAPGFATGGFTTGDKFYRAGERGREAITSAWATHKVESTSPGTFNHINKTGELPSTGGDYYYLDLKGVSAQDAPAIEAAVERVMAKKAKTAQRTYSDRTTRGSR